MKMASREKTRDELDMKTLRELAALPANKYCFDCGQRGPTYVNVTIGAFVCSSCGGLLRGLNPPHRVKSLTVCSFTEVEMDRIKSRGNEYCTHIWLGKYDAKSCETDFTSPDKRKEFMRLKYEEKKFYVDPREAIKKMKPRAPAVPSTPASVSQSKSQSVIQNTETSNLQKSGTMSQTFSAGDVLNKTVPDIFKEIENDPFKNVKEDAANNESFADFSSAFGNNTGSKTASTSGQNQNSPLVSSSTGIPSASYKKPAPPPPDRYAALADLDNQLHQQVVSEIPVPSTITSSTAPAFWSTIPASVLATATPNPFNGTWSHQQIVTPNPFQCVSSGNAPLPHSSFNLPNTKPSLSNGTVTTPFWPSNQAWSSQPDGFQNTVADNYNPWPQSCSGGTAANPFLNGSFGGSQTTNTPKAPAGKNPFL